MSREWKPGDVALVMDARGRTGRAMRGAVGWDFTPSGHSLNAYSGESEPIEAHPQLVIEPQRLTWDRRIPTAAEFTEWAESLPAGEFATGILIIADALRDLPDAIIPKLDEPPGLGAVVRDRKGVLWVRAEKAKGMRNPWQDTLNSVAGDDRIRAAAWSDIDVASADDILSEGVEVDR